MLSDFHKTTLYAGGGHQTPRKAAQSLQNEVGQSIEKENRDKRFRDGDPSWGGSRKGQLCTQ